MRRWGKTRPRSKPVLMLLSVAIMLGGVLLYIVYNIIVPFRTENPLWREATVHEAVIDKWVYDGYNEEGYLVFHNEEDGTNYELAPNDKMLALDGKFVMIEKSSPESVVYAPPMNSLPGEGWMILGVFLLVPAAGLVFYRRLRRRPRWFRGRARGWRTQVAPGATFSLHKSQAFHTRRRPRRR